jgi:hypothetical protein
MAFYPSAVPPGIDAELMDACGSQAREKSGRRNRWVETFEGPAPWPTQRQLAVAWWAP